MTTSVTTVRFSASWQTQFRFTQTIGRGLAEDTGAKVVVVAGGATLESGDVDLAFAKSVNNEHRYTGKGLYAGPEPVRWLRTIAWLPQEDRYLFAAAPQTGISSFEDIAAKKPALNMVAQRSVAPVLKEYGFSFEDIEQWGGHVGSMHHTAHAAKEHFAEGRLDACFGDGSEFDGSAWRWMAERGYQFLDIRPDVMEALERKYGLRRNRTPAGFLPGITRNLLALDDSHVVLTCHQRLDADLAYALAKVIDERKHEIERNSIQITVGEGGRLPLAETAYWSSMTEPIEKQWDPRVLGAPLHEGAERYYRERGIL
jgi:TRAP-type uncharacterized transport system substrate-binding protein